VSPTNTVNRISTDTGITVRVLLGAVGVLVTIITSVVGVGVAGLLKMNQLESEIKEFRIELIAASEIKEQATDYRLRSIEDELEKRAPIIFGQGDPWTIEDMRRWAFALERSLHSNGVEIAIQDPKATKDGR